jgi:methylmalonyl-CoA/ethylmalonyl-CoA epimerase
MLASSDFKLSQIGQIAILVADLGRAVEFYEHKLGLPHLFTVSNLGFFDCGGIRLMLSVPETEEFNRPSSVIYFKVDDIQAAYQTLSARGVHFEDSPHLIAKMETYDLWMTFFRDSENNLLSLMSEASRSTTD